MDNLAGVRWTLLGLGVAIILGAVAFAFLKLINPSPNISSVTQSLESLVYVIIEVLFLAVAIWGGTILLDRGLRAR